MPTLIWQAAGLFIAVRVLVFRKVRHLQVAFSIDLVPYNHAGCSNIRKECIAIDRVSRKDFHLDLLGPVIHAPFTVCERPQADEQQARAAGLGLWSGAAARPEMFRADVKAAPPPEVTPAGCAIKGNISASGKIFHQPGDLDYSRTRISEAKGERWFCSVDAAMAARWRAARR